MKTPIFCRKVANSSFLLISALMISACDGAGSALTSTTTSNSEDRDFSKLIEFPVADNPECPAWTAGQTVIISENTTLPLNCSFEKVTLQIVAPNITLDCNNAVFNGTRSINRNGFDQPYTADSAPVDFGILIAGSQYDSTRLTDITIRHCQFLNYVNGAFIYVDLTEQTREALRKGAYDEQSLRDMAPSNISIIGSKLINSHQHGIFVHRYVTDFRLRGSEIKGSGNSGLYLEAGSRYADIENNVFEGNGYSSYSPDALTRNPRKSSNSRREAIAIDGSRYNIISNNRFISNGDGGVFLYKNCWEDAKNPRTLPRSEGANNNVIEGNEFLNEEVGVWLAERADRNLSNFDCGDPLVYEALGGKYYRDRASENTVKQNTFRSVKTGIRVHDSDNTVVDNTFVNTEELDIEIGSEIRILTGDPVSNTVLDKNELSRTDGIAYRE